MNAHDYGNQPAYPSTASREVHAHATSDTTGEATIHATAQHPGMTIRDAFVKAAMQGFIISTPDMDGEEVGIYAANYADATIAEMVGGAK